VPGTPPDFCARDLGKFWMALTWHLRASTDPAHSRLVRKIEHRYYTMQRSAADMVDWLQAHEIAILGLMHLQQSAADEYPCLDACGAFVTQRAALCASRHATERLAYWSETLSKGLGAAKSIGATVPASCTSVETSG